MIDPKNDWPDDDSPAWTDDSSNGTVRPRTRKTTATTSSRFVRPDLPFRQSRGFRIRGKPRLRLEVK